MSTAKMREVYKAYQEDVRVAVDAASEVINHQKKVEIAQVEAACDEKIIGVQEVLEQQWDTINDLTQQIGELNNALSQVGGVAAGWEDDDTPDGGDMLRSGGGDG